jgi:thioredoxin 1
MSFVRALVPALVAVAAVASPAYAAQVQKFDRAAFVAAQAAGKPILVEVKAWWCPVCASQGSTIKKIAADPAYGQLVIFEVNYDSQKPEWQAFGVRKQGTLISFRGKRELGRLEFVTDKAQIGALLANTVR